MALAVIVGRMGLGGGRGDCFVVLVMEGGRVGR